MSKSSFVGNVQSRSTTNSCNNEADSKDFTRTSLFLDIAQHRCVLAKPLLANNISPTLKGPQEQNFAPCEL